MLSDRRNISVVLAEDDRVVSMAVAHAAKEAGLTVVGAAANGREALDMIRELSPDVAVFDIWMPVMDGLEAARRVQEEKPTPVVLLTSCNTPEFLEEATRCGVGAYLAKPPDAESLRCSTAIAMARHADLMELRRMNGELQALLEEVKTLRGLLPICASCKKIRDGKGEWQEVESYIQSHTDAQFTHGICPDCVKRFYPEYS